MIRPFRISTRRRSQPAADVLLAELRHARQQALRRHVVDDQIGAARWEGRAEGLATALREGERAAMGASR